MINASRAAWKAGKYIFLIFQIFLKISVDIWLNVLYYNQAVARERLKHKKCRSGGIGRRAGFRCLWSQDRVGSSPISCIIFFFCYGMQEPFPTYSDPVAFFCCAIFLCTTEFFFARILLKKALCYGTILKI